MADTRPLADALSKATAAAYGVTKFADDGEATVGEAVQSNDSRLSNGRPPTGTAGGVLAGSYPNPTFATPMATTAELEALEDIVTEDVTDLATHVAFAATETELGHITLADLAASTFDNPMTAEHDIIVGGVAGALDVLPVGANGTYLGVVGGALTYAPIDVDADIAAHAAVMANATDTDGHMAWEDKAKLDTYPAITDVALLGRATLQEWTGPHKFNAAVELAAALASTDATNSYFMGKLSIGIGTAQLAKLAVVHSHTGSAYTSHRGLQFSVNAADPTGVANSSEVSGVYGITQITATNTSDNTNTNGVSAIVADVRTAAGATGTLTNVQGVLVTNLINAGTTPITALYGMRINAATNPGAQTIGQLVGLALNQQTVGAKNTLLLLGTLTAAAGNYSIYSASAYQSYFAGSVGIGVAVPTANLHVLSNGSATAAPTFEAESGGTGITNTNTALRLRKLGTDNDEYLRVNFDANDTGGTNRGFVSIAAHYRNHTTGSITGDLLFATQHLSTYNEKMRILSSGEVGIGTATPGEKLEVNGNVKATKYIGASKVLGWYYETLPSSATLGPTYTIDRDMTVTSAAGWAEVVATGSAAQVDIQYKRGAGAWTSIFSTKPSFAVGANAITAGTIAVASLNSGDLVRNRWVGTPAAIADVTVQLNMTVR